ncbi:MAG: hypothetical protein EP347_08870, partial [Alphaproteobacteria bacterium]
MPQVSRKIDSAAEFVKILSSDNPQERMKATWVEADLEVWIDIIEQFPEVRKQVIGNKNVPLEILRVLARD